MDPINQHVPINLYTGVLDHHSGNGMTVLSGVGVGGRSLVNNAALVQPTQELFSRQFPALDYDQFAEVYYPRVRSIIQPATNTCGYPRIFLLSLHTGLFCHGVGRELGSHKSFIQSALDWNIDPGKRCVEPGYHLQSLERFGMG